MPVYGDDADMQMLIIILELQLTIIFIIDYVLDLVYKMCVCEYGENGPSQFPKARSDVFKCQTNSPQLKDIQLTIVED